MKRLVVQFFQKYGFNPQVKLLIAMGIAPRAYALVETTGAKTGKQRRVPVGNGLVGNEFWIVAEHGRKAAYVRNIERNPRVRVKVRDSQGLRWRMAPVRFSHRPSLSAAKMARRKSSRRRKKRRRRPFFRHGISLTIKITLDD